MLHVTNKKSAAANRHVQLRTFTNEHCTNVFMYTGGC